MTDSNEIEVPPGEEVHPALPPSAYGSNEIEDEQQPSDLINGQYPHVQAASVIDTQNYAEPYDSGYLYDPHNGSYDNTNGVYDSNGADGSGFNGHGAAAAAAAAAAVHYDEHGQPVYSDRFAEQYNGQFADPSHYNGFSSEAHVLSDGQSESESDGEHPGTTHDALQTAAAAFAPPVPPPRKTQEEKQRQEEIRTLKHYLKQAMEVKNMNVSKDLIEKLSHFHINSSNDDLVLQASASIKQMESSSRDAEIETIKFYLKQAMELKNRDALLMALEKASKVTGTSRLHADFNILVQQAQKIVDGLDQENIETIKFYMRQGIQLRNRDVLKQSMDKAATLKPGTIEEDLMNQATEQLKRLDAENLILFYIDTAMKQKDLEALQSALNKAIALKMNPQLEKLKEAHKLVDHLEKKKRKKEKSRFSSLFGKKGKKLVPTKLFGEPLDVAVARDPYIVPKICVICIEYLKQNGMREAGLFRIAGSKESIEALRASFDADDGAEIKFDSVHDAAGLLKQYLRSLPEPLIPYACYHDFLEVAAFAQKDPRRTETLKHLISQIPRNNYNLLSYLMYFLHDLTKYEEENKMNANNVAIVFAPNLLRPEQETPQSMLTEMPQCIGIISTMVAYVTGCIDPPPSNMFKPAAEHKANADDAESSVSHAGPHHSHTMPHVSPPASPRARPKTPSSPRKGTV